MKNKMYIIGQSSSAHPQLLHKYVDNNYCVITWTPHHLFTFDPISNALWRILWRHGVYWYSHVGCI